MKNEDFLNGNLVISPLFYFTFSNLKILMNIVVVTLNLDKQIEEKSSTVGK